MSSKLSKRIKLVNLGDGITTAQEAWLDELTKPSNVEEEKELEAREYIQQLAERTIEVAFLREHARKISEHAFVFKR